MAADGADDGGPAFPVVTNQYHYGHEKDMPAAVDPGMTLRDYFAARAMQALLHGLLQAAAKEPEEAVDRALLVLAPAAYRVADDMLRERSKP